MLGLLIIGILPVCVIVFLLVTLCLCIFFFFFFNDTATTEIYTLSLHDALPICSGPPRTAGTTANPWPRPVPGTAAAGGRWPDRKSTRLNSSHLVISYAVFCLKKKKQKYYPHNFLLPISSHIDYRLPTVPHIITH